LVYAAVVLGGVLVVGSRRSWVEAIVRAVAGSIAWLRRSRAPRLSPDVEVAESIERLRTNRRAAAALFAAAIGGKVVGAAGLLLVTGALGVHVGVLAALLIYTLTLLASTLGPLPAGMGTTELALGALLVAAGATGPAAAAAVIAFRAIDVWLPLLIGGAAACHRGEYVARRESLAQPPTVGSGSTLPELEAAA
jgi:uncharacterized membrane protein YbhN (UPF0104 family)